MKHLEALRREMNARPDTSGRLMRDVYMARGYAALGFSTGLALVILLL